MYVCMYVGVRVCVEHVTLRRRCALIAAAPTARSAVEMTHGDGGRKIFHIR